MNMQGPLGNTIAAQFKAEQEFFLNLRKNDFISFLLGTDDENVLSMYLSRAAYSLLEELTNVPQQGDGDAVPSSSSSTRVYQGPITPAIKTYIKDIVESRGPLYLAHKKALFLSVLYIGGMSGILGLILNGNPATGVPPFCLSTRDEPFQQFMKRLAQLIEVFRKQTYHMTSEDFVATVLLNYEQICGLIQRPHVLDIDPLKHIFDQSGVPNHLLQVRNNDRETPLF